MTGLIEWGLFLGLSSLAVVMAASMLLTMSMYRAGLALMSSFLALAGLFVLLDADLLAAIQVMMNVGGMLVMMLFMVMIMMDPGGEMMWDMKRKMHLPGLGAFSMRMPREKPPEAQPDSAESGPAPEMKWTCPMHPEVQQERPGNCPKCGMALVAAQQQPNQQKPEHEAGQHGREQHQMNPREHHQMLVDMAMSTGQLPWALTIGAASALFMIVLMVRTAWPVTAARPTQDATIAVGELLLLRYMIGFEGAAFLILAGMVGAVVFGKREMQAVAYTCPMHPQVMQPAPGSCPHCGMNLAPHKGALG